MTKAPGGDFKSTSVLSPGELQSMGGNISARGSSLHARRLEAYRGPSANTLLLRPDGTSLRSAACSDRVWPAPFSSPLGLRILGLLRF